jgi:hypothetical protein
MKRTALALLPLSLLVAGCESSSRFDGMFGSNSAPVASRPLAPEPGMAAPTAPVTAQPLPPVAGTTDPSMAPVPGAPGAAAGTAPGPAGTPPPATNQAVASATPAPAPASARGLAGSWKISDAARGSCSIALTQQSLLDLYRASPSGCQAGSLAKVNAWQQRGQEIVLLEPGGRTAVRLFPKGDGTYEGAATTSGAIIRMSR